ncbi:Nnf1-domain-containing protein [Chaetomium strumarium]|uniref:Nnf1-domain-containing protein n=1 Tax=Chaetomium strumarium TaxID=1170767 RepID=A0AAJ0GMD8_9PEZI|nr:Nnf1-domain-containing protein [Chaetomium strumarium]
MPSKQDPPHGAQQQQDTEMLDTPQLPPPPPPPPPQTETASGQADSTGASASAPEQQREQEPSSDPDPPPPQDTAAPITPGPRAARLQALFASTAKHTLDKINRDNFAACFPTIAARAPGTLEFVQRQMVERLGGLWNREFETIMSNRQVVARLNELEGLVGDAARRRLEAGDGAAPPVAPHTLPAETILSAHLNPHLAHQRSQLNAKLQNTQASNAKLWEEIQAQRSEMEALLAGVEKILRDMDGANVLLGEVVEELAEETRGAERDVMTVQTAGTR